MSSILKDARLERYNMITGEEAKEKIISILKASDIGRLSLLDERYPYIIPTNHVCFRGGLVMHGSFGGKKIELMKRSKLASYEVDYPLEAPKTKVLTCHLEYESTILYGEVRPVDDREERYECLKALSDEYGLPFKHGGEEGCNALFFLIHEATARTGRFLPAAQKDLYYYSFRIGEGGNHEV